MLPPDELTPEAGIDESLLALQPQELMDAFVEEHNRLAANGFIYEQNIVLPTIELIARILGVERKLMEMGLYTQDDINRYTIAFKVTHMRHVAEQILPQIRSAQARAAILQPGVVPNASQLPGKGH